MKERAKPQHYLTRRQFLKAMAVGGITVAGFSLPALWSSSAVKQNSCATPRFCPAEQVYDWTQGRCVPDPMLNCSGAELTHASDIDLQQLKYDGEIYDGHNHIWLIPEIFFLQYGCDVLPSAYVLPIPVLDHFVYWLFYARHIGYSGSINLGFPNAGGLLDYRPPEPGLACHEVNIGGRAGPFHNAAVLYTKMASHDPREGRYRTFAFGSLDYRFLLELVASGLSSQAIEEEAKAELVRQVNQLAAVGFDGLKFKPERSRGSGGPFMWGKALDIPGLPEGFWDLDGEVFMAVWEAVAQNGLAVTFHLDDAGSVAKRNLYWGDGGILDKVLGNTPGLKFIVAHGFGPLASVNLKYRQVFDAQGHDPHGECQKGWDQLTALLERYNGREGRAKLYMDMIEESFLYMADELHNANGAGREWVEQHSKSIFIGVDPIAAAARDFQSGCRRHEIEHRYFRMRKLLETKEVVTKWIGSAFQSVQGLNLPKPTLQDLYQNNVLSIVNGGKREVDRSQALAMVDELIEGVDYKARGYSYQCDPLIQELLRVKEFMMITPEAG